MIKAFKFGRFNIGFTAFRRLFKVRAEIFIRIAIRLEDCCALFILAKLRPP
jgi:hypothetical protein